MENSFLPGFESTESESYRLYLYVEQVRCETEARLKRIENQLDTIKKLLEGGKTQ